MASERRSSSGCLPALAVGVLLCLLCFFGSIAMAIYQDAVRLYQQMEAWFHKHRVPIYVGVALAVVLVITFKLLAARRASGGHGRRRQDDEVNDS